jgi:hypothetical protein
LKFHMSIQTFVFIPLKFKLYVFEVHTFYTMGTISIYHRTPLTNSVAWVRERTIPTEWPPLVGEVSVNFLPIEVPSGQRDWSLRPYSHFLDRSWYFFFQVAPHLYSQGWMDPVPDPLLLRKSGSAENRTRTSGSVARSSDYDCNYDYHWLVLYHV